MRFHCVAGPCRPPRNVSRADDIANSWAPIFVVAQVGDTGGGDTGFGAFEAETAREAWMGPQGYPVCRSRGLGW